MKKLAPIILAILSGIAPAKAQDSINFEVAAPTVVEKGASFRIEFTISSMTVDDFTPPDFGDFEVQAGPIMSQGGYMGTNTQGDVIFIEGTTCSYVIRGNSTGVKTISAAGATVGGNNYSTKPLSIEVVDAAPSAGAAGQGSVPEITDEDVFVLATANRAEIYKEEPVVVTFKLYRRINAGLDEVKLPTFNGFWYQDITPANPVWERERYNNRVYEAVTLKEYLLYPQLSGTLTIEPLEATARAAFQIRTSTPRDFFEEFMGMGDEIREVTKRIASGPVRIDVREWPAGAPEHFDGAVGDFKLEATPPPSAMSANTSGTYTLRLSGTGNFPLIRAPKLTLPPSFEQYNVTTSDNTRHTRSGTGGYREFSYPFVPRSDGLYTIQPFEFAYFDPHQRRYITLYSRETSIEVAADSTAVTTVPGGGMVSGVSREDLRIFGQDIRFIKRGGANLRPKGRTFMFSPLYISLAALFAAVFVVGLLILPRYVRNMQSDRFVRGKRANKAALKRFRAAEISMKRDDKHGFYDEMLKALWGYTSDKFDIPPADLSKDRIREELFERSIPEAQSIEYIRIISECEEAQYSPVASSRMGELYREGVALVSELESAIKIRQAL